MTQEHEFQCSSESSYDISKDLSVSGFGAYSYASNENDQFCPTWVWAQGNLYRGEFKSEEWLANVQANYQHVWGIHDLKAMAGAEYQKDVRSGILDFSQGHYQ